MKYDLKILQDYIDKKLIHMQVHPTLPLRIYKHTQECVFSRKWDDITLNMRGTVLDENGEQISNPFPKFFNIDELDALGISLPNLIYKVYEKMDGSLIEAFWYNDELVFSSAGSFTSPQAIVAKEIFEKKYSHLIKYMRKNLTVLFELIYPLNKIVLDYGDEEKLVVLALRDIEKGDSLKVAPNILRYWEHYGFDVAHEVDMSLDELKAEIKRDDFLNKEGFVVVFENGFRVKMKYTEYFRLHKIVSNVNEKFVWEFMSQGKDIQLDNIPDETFQFIKNTKKELQSAFDSRWLESNSIYLSILANLGPNYTKKDFALAILPKYKKISGILFHLYENRIELAKKSIWKMLEPKYEKGASGFQSMKIDI